MKRELEKKATLRMKNDKLKFANAKIEDTTIQDFNLISRVFTPFKKLIFSHVSAAITAGTFPLDRGQIHTVSYTANKPGTITYWCHVHTPNMVGDILVLPKPA